jgi:ABC-type branched-subunit amino acid transport system ATPase component
VPLLECRGLGRRFGGLWALRDVDLAVHEGEILGLIGPNGAGKTTLFNVVSGVLRPTTGTVHYRGRRIDGWPVHRIVRSGLGRTFQIPRPFRHLPAWENVLVALGHAHYASLPASLGRARTPEDIHRALELLEQVGLGAFAKTPAGKLPLGAQRRLEIARALGLDPALLLLDEPMAGLSSAESDALADLILRLRAQGRTIVLVEHNVAVAMRLCDRIVVLHHGRVLREGRPEEVRVDPRVIEAYLGEEADRAAG